VEGYYCSSCLIQLFKYIKNKSLISTTTILIVGSSNNLNDITVFKSIENRLILEKNKPQIYFINKKVILKKFSKYNKQSPSLYIVSKKKYYRYIELFNNQLKLKLK
jgi:hypothetical protein